MYFTNITCSFLPVAIFSCYCPAVPCVSLLTADGRSGKLQTISRKWQNEITLAELMMPHVRISISAIRHHHHEA